MVMGTLTIEGFINSTLREERDFHDVVSCRWALTGLLRLTSSLDAAACLKNYRLVVTAG